VRSIKIVGHIFMHNDQKPGIRIIVERVSVTTVRTRSRKVYCEMCRRSLDADEIHLAPPATERRDAIEAAATDNVKE
jgi:hypothetical protein